MVSQFGSLGYTIMGRLLIWPLSRRQSLTPFTRRVSHKHSLTKKLAVHRVLYPSMLTKLSGRKKCGRKRCTTNRENRSLMRIVKQNRFKNLGELHKKWTEAGVKASRAPHTDVSRNLATVVVFLLLSHSWTTDNVRGVLPGLRRSRTGLWSKVLFSDESKFCISFGNQGPRV